MDRPQNGAPLLNATSTMRLSSESAPFLHRRRGTSSRSDLLTIHPRVLLILLGVAATIFLSVLLLLTSHPQTNSASSSVQNVAEPPIDIQNLILESARAEAAESQLRQLEVEARRRGDERMVQHLRGKLAPGDVNYNPHRGVDDTEGEGGVEGDGAMYAGDGQGEKVNEEENTENDDKENTENDDKENTEIEEDASKAGEESNQEEQTETNNETHESKEQPAHQPRLRGGSNSNPAPTYPYMTSPQPFNITAYLPLGPDRFPEYKDGSTPYALPPSLIQQSDELARSRRIHVANAMRHIWKNYQELAFGKDEMHPISGTGGDNWGGMGTTLVDALDTLWLMGLKDEFYQARDWVRDSLSHSHVSDVSVFETTIRSLGGLLSAYDLSGDEAFLDKADDLGSRLFKAYETSSGLPRGSVNLQSGSWHNFGWNGNQFILAEVGTQQIEYRYLARATGKKDYATKSEKVFEILHQLMPEDGLLKESLQEDGSGSAYFSKDKVSFGAMSDSAYEYMIKLWIQGGRKEQMYREMWDRAMDGVHDQLVQKSSPNGLTYLADRVNGRLDHKMDHLACFMGGSLAIGAYTDPNGLDSPRAQRDLKTAKALTYTCYQMYARTKTGISPEMVQFTGANDFIVPSNAPFYILRPEAVEAFYYLSALTGDPIYREWGWEVFQSIEKYCKTKYGYGSLHHVDKPNLPPEDRMESFFLAETLKYLYLLFDPDSEIDVLNKHIFNTEAHPVRIFDSMK